MTAQHTPTPWTVFPHALGSIWVGDEQVAACDWVVDDEHEYRVKDIAQRHANAAFIVKACNAHDDLVAALNQLLIQTSSGSQPCGLEFIIAARAALAKAGAP